MVKDDNGPAFHFRCILKWLEDGRSEVIVGSAHGDVFGGVFFFIVHMFFLQMLFSGLRTPQSLASIPFLRHRTKSILASLDLRNTIQQLLSKVLVLIWICSANLRDSLDPEFLIIYLFNLQLPLHCVGNQDVVTKLVEHLRRGHDKKQIVLICVRTIVFFFLLPWNLG